MKKILIILGVIIYPLVFGAGERTIRNGVIITNDVDTLYIIKDDNSNFRIYSPTTNLIGVFDTLFIGNDTIVNADSVLFSYFSDTSTFASISDTSTYAISSGSGLSYTNGLVVDGSDVKLGDSLIESTTIELDSNAFVIKQTNAFGAGYQPIYFKVSSEAYAESITISASEDSSIHRILIDKNNGVFITSSNTINDYNVNRIKLFNNEFVLDAASDVTTERMQILIDTHSVSIRNTDDLDTIYLFGKDDAIINADINIVGGFSIGGGNVLTTSDTVDLKTAVESETFDSTKINKLILPNYTNEENEYQLYLNPTTGEVTAAEVTHGYLYFQDSVITVNLVDDVWSEVTNATDSIFIVVENEHFDYILGDTIQINTTGHLKWFPELDFYGDAGENFEMEIYNTTQDYSVPKRKYNEGSGATDRASMNGMCYDINCISGDKYIMRWRNIDGGDPNAELLGASIYLEITHAE